jgi:hypothetical protein
VNAQRRVAASLALAFALVATTARAQATASASKTDDTPTIRLGVQLFTDYTYTEAPTITDADGNAVHANAFDVSRAYVNITGTLSHLVSFRITPDVRRLVTTSKLPAEASVSPSIEGSEVFRIKYAYGQVNLDQWTTKGTWLRIGTQQTPVIDYLENVYRYRFQGTVFANREGFLDSSDFGISGHYSAPKDYGEVHLGVYNGETYGKGETNDEKSFQVRGTVRPFASGRPALRGLRLTAFYDADHYVAGAPRNRLLANATFEHRYVNAGFEYLKTKDQTSRTAPVVDGEGWSIWTTPRTSKGFEALLRHDSLKPNDSVDARKTRDIVGLSYWFRTTIAAAQAALLADYEQVKYDAALAKPAERRFALHCLFQF